MIIKEINSNIFDEYAKNHFLANEFQLSNYGEIKKNLKYEILYIGAYENGALVGAGLILSKLIAPTVRYGYVPRGFLIDYYDKDLFTKFTKALKSYFLLKNFAFIKMNPGIIYSIINSEKKTKEINSLNKNLVAFLGTLGFQKLKSSPYFDSILPIYNPIVDLNTFDFESLSDKDKNDIKETEYLGLKAKISDENDIKYFYEFIKDKKNNTVNYYEEYYKSYKKDNLIDLIIIELDHTVYLKLLQEAYEIEENNNEVLNKKYIEDHNNMELYNAKMLSDKNLNDIKNEIIAITKIIKEKSKSIVAGALITKFKNKVSIVINGHDKNFANLNSKLYLFYYIINYYKNLGYEYLDLNGITVDFNEGNPYKTLNEFKLKFNPTIYEYIGEFDLIINSAFYQMLWSSGKLNKEFQKERVSN